MINTIIFLLKVLVAVLPTLGLCVLLEKNNFEKAYRNKQYSIPVMALIYCLFMMIFSQKFYDLLITLIKWIQNALKSVANASFWSDGVGTFIRNIVYFFNSFLNSINLKFWMMFITNFMIMAIYFGYKKICLKVIKKTIGNLEYYSEESVRYWLFGRTYKAITDKFYEYSNDNGVWCLKEKCYQMRAMWKAFFWASITISFALLFRTADLYKHRELVNIFYPVFGIILVSEIYFYFDGLTLQEYKNKILGEEEDSAHRANYSLMRKYLRVIFGDRLNAENTSNYSSAYYSLTTDEIISELEKNEDSKIVAYASYLRKINKNGVVLNHSYIYSTIDMLNGKSVLFNNPFYNDLIPYAFYPMNRTILKHKKVLIVLGRHSIENDIKQWISSGIEAVTNIPFMWNVKILTEKKQDNVDIGIITRSDIMNVTLQNQNREFLNDVEFFVIIEPSKIISTAQIGLNLLAQKCGDESRNNLVFCMCDKNCDGLVDAMSHVLMTNITEVSATYKQYGTSSYMSWKADGEQLTGRIIPNISKYLGVGTELSFAAFKNQVAEAEWYGGENFPVTDMKWIAGQYYYDLMKYAGLPEEQEYMSEIFKTSASFWNAKIKENNYFVVEDEFNNMFEIVRDFSTRSKNQGFINVISPEYMLKDYMAENASVFETDPKAIPYITADYARTRRNVTFRILLMMSCIDVNEDAIAKEFTLMGIDVFDVKKQLWYEIYLCFATSSEMEDVSKMEYESAVEYVYNKTINYSEDISISRDIITINEVYNFTKAAYENIYKISKKFETKFIDEIKSAEFVAEDEKGQLHYLGAELKGHIYQKYLPGQFFTFGGKYYEMQYVTVPGKVLIRRAADHISNRKYYRQIRHYNLEGIRVSNDIGAIKDVSGLKFIKEYADITVSTDGYLLLDKYNNIKNAKTVLLKGENSGIPNRMYRNKEILKIELPDLDGAYNDKVRYTITLMLNELFRTLFAENQSYIVALTDLDGIDTSDVKPMTYDIKLSNEEMSNKCIYIIEDSQVDLGLTIAVERNIQRIFEILQDYLEWHVEELEKSLNTESEDDESDENESDENESDENTGDGKNNKSDASKDKETEGQSDSNRSSEKKSLLRRIKEFFLKHLGMKKGKEDTKEQPIEGEESSEEREENTIEDKVEDVVEDEVNPKKPNSLENKEGEEKKVDKQDSRGELFRKIPYYENYYMLYGGEGEPVALDLVGTSEYFKALLGENNTSLKQARDSRKISKYVERSYRPNKTNVRYCNFCGVEILGVEYDTLIDGRDRCVTCSRSVVKSEEELKRIFEDVHRNLESFFGIKIAAGIKVEMVNAQSLHKALGMTFTPKEKNKGRVLGVAIKQDSGFRLLIENGSPRIKAIMTMAHELTHIWQYQNWNAKQIRKTYGRSLELQIYEGMAKWVEIQYAYLINEHAIAKREEIITAYRRDEYGFGFLRYRANYKLITDNIIVGNTPFSFVTRPLSMNYVGQVSIPMEFFQLPEEDEEKKDDNTFDFRNNKKGFKKQRVKKDLGEKNRSRDNLKSYCREQLNDEEKKVYDTLLKSIIQFETKVELEKEYSKENIRKIEDGIMKDHCEIDWFNYGLTLLVDDKGMCSSAELKYCMTKEESEHRRNAIEEVVDSYLKGVNEELSDYAAVIKVYENLIDYVDYDTIGLNNQKKSDSGEIDDLRSVYGTLVNKKAVCAGYSKAFKYLMDKIGIECMYITGEVKEGLHAWNMIKLEGDYYYIDTTWGDRSDTDKVKSSEGIYYNYFCITTDELLIDHTPDESNYKLPKCIATKCDYFVRNGLYLKKYSINKIKDITLTSINSGIFDISFKFENSNAAREAKQKLIDEKEWYEVMQYVNLKNGKIINSSSYSYVADKIDKGILIFHVNRI